MENFKKFLNRIKTNTLTVGNDKDITPEGTLRVRSRFGKVTPSMLRDLDEALQERNKTTEAHPHITGLSFYDSKLGPEGAKALGDLLANTTSLQYLDLQSNNIGPEGIKALEPFLTDNTSLKSLNLTGNNLGPEGAKALGTFLTDNTSLKSLDIHNNNLGSEGAKALEPFLANNTSLQFLYLGRNNIGPEGAKALGAFLANNTSLQYLDIRWQELGLEGGKALGTFLIKDKTLKTLNLTYNKLGPEGGKALGAFLADNTSLQSLNLTGNNLGPEGVAALETFLANNTTLKSLDLWVNNLGPEGAKVLGAFLANNTSLQYLNLGDNKLGPEGIKALEPFLANNTTLKSLDLRSNKLGPEGIKVLEPFLANNTSLQSLNLSYGNLGPEGVAALETFLANNTSLQYLDLGENKLGPEGVKALLPLLANTTSLKSLNLERNNLGPEGVKALEPFLTNNTTLQSLNLGGNNLGPEGIKALGALLADNTSLKSLNLHNSEIGPEEIKALGPFLANNTSLESLKLVFNKLGPEGVAALLTFLADNTSLTTLYVHRSEPGSKGIKALLTFLANNTSLRVLGIGAEVDIKSIKAIAQLLESRKNTSVTYMETSFDTPYPIRKRIEQRLEFNSLLKRVRTNTLRPEDTDENGLLDLRRTALPYSEVISGTSKKMSAYEDILLLIKALPNNTAITGLQLPGKPFLSKKQAQRLEEIFQKRKANPQQPIDELITQAPGLLTKAKNTMAGGLWGGTNRKPAKPEVDTQALAIQMGRLQESHKNLKTTVGNKAEITQLQAVKKQLDTLQGLVTQLDNTEAIQKGLELIKQILSEEGVTNLGDIEARLKQVHAFVQEHATELAKLSNASKAKNFKDAQLAAALTDPEAQLYAYNMVADLNRLYLAAAVAKTPYFTPNEGMGKTTGTIIEIVGKLVPVAGDYIELGGMVVQELSERRTEARLAHAAALAQSPEEMNAIAQGVLRELALNNPGALNPKQYKKQFKRIVKAVLSGKLKALAVPGPNRTQHIIHALANVAEGKDIQHRRQALPTLPSVHPLQQSNAKILQTSLREGLKKIRVAVSNEQDQEETQAPKSVTEIEELVEEMKKILQEVKSLLPELKSANTTAELPPKAVQKPLVELNEAEKLVAAKKKAALLLPDLQKVITLMQTETFLEPKNKEEQALCTKIELWLNRNRKAIFETTALSGKAESRVERSLICALFDRSIRDKNFATLLLDRKNEEVVQEKIQEFVEHEYTKIDPMTINVEDIDTATRLFSENLAQEMSTAQQEVVTPTPPKVRRKSTVTVGGSGF